MEALQILSCDQALLMPPSLAIIEKGRSFRAADVLRAG
jgi:hypothetical protein